MNQLDIDRTELAKALGCTLPSFSNTIPIEFTVFDFRSLVIPMRGLGAMRKLSPNFDALSRISNEKNLDTIALFSMKTETDECDVHIREFTPILGTYESAATGTTNRALACYLFRHALISPYASSSCRIQVEQGYEMDRPSQIGVEFEVDGGSIVEIAVGDIASRLTQPEPLTYSWVIKVRQSVMLGSQMFHVQKSCF